MRKHLFCLFAITFCTGVLSGDELRLIPYPQSVKTGAGELVLRSPVRIALASKSAEDRFAVGLLIDDLKVLDRVDATITSGAKKRSSVLIGRMGEAAIDNEVRRLQLDPSLLNRSESYLLDVGDSGVLVTAKSAGGIFYGIQTLRQLIRVVGTQAQIPHVSITDWPALRYRGVSIDISRGPIMTEEQIQTMIRNFAEYKLNMLSFYMEHVFKYSHAPIVAPEGGEITPELMQRVVDYARQYHIDVVPQQQTFGHLGHMLKLERYADLGEVPHGGVLAPEDDRTYEWIRQAAAQLVASTRSPFLHIGSDETQELGQGRSRTSVERLGFGNVYAGHLRRVAEMLRPLNRRLMFWGDMALHHPELIPKLPKDMVAMTWEYDPGEDFSSYIAPFRNAGLEVFVCPGLNNWRRIFPNFSNALPNINSFVRDGKKLGALGMLNTEWGDDGESVVNLTWYGIVFSAAAAWQPGKVDVQAFDRAFDWAFYRSNSSTFVKAIHQLDQIHSLLVSSGVGDANNETMFWFDPFSRYGAECVKKALPVASQIRRLAEDTLVEVSEHSDEAILHRDTLPFLRFAAKRLDYVGMKIQFSQDIADAYRGKREMGIGENRAWDLRYAVNDLKGMCRTLWLAENRSYWLDNVLVRYDLEALYWTQKARLFAEARQQYWHWKTLPSLESLGLRYLP